MASRCAGVSKWERRIGGWRQHPLRAGLGIHVRKKISMLWWDETIRTYTNEIDQLVRAELGKLDCDAIEGTAGSPRWPHRAAFPNGVARKCFTVRPPVSNALLSPSLAASPSIWSNHQGTNTAVYKTWWPFVCRAEAELASALTAAVVDSQWRSYGSCGCLPPRYSTSAGDRLPITRCQAGQRTYCGPWDCLARNAC
jgi:hypothetical protein